MLRCPLRVQGLRKLTLSLLDRATPPGGLAQACAELYQWFADAAQLDATPGEAMRLPTGLALPPEAAAQCILDTNRTVAFVRGVSLALEEARRRFPHGVLEVLYAGTGPFAPLLLPLMATRPTRDVLVTFLDAHQRSVDSVQLLTERLGLGQRTRLIACGDAASYRHPAPIHLLVTETLQRSLAVEPFVGIVRNLRPQLAPGGLIVPDRVAVQVAMIDAVAEQARWSHLAPPAAHQSLRELFEVTAQGELPPLDPHGRSEPVAVTLPEQPPERECWVALSTSIDVFGDLQLRAYESGLTVPEILWPLSPARGGERIEFHYALDQAPGIRWRRC